MKKKRKLPTIIAHWMFIIFVLMFFISALLMWFFLSNSIVNRTRNKVRATINAVNSYAVQQADYALSESAKTIYSGYVEPIQDKSDDPADISNFFKKQKEWIVNDGVATFNLNLINKDGIIIASNVDKCVGLNLHDEPDGTGILEFVRGGFSSDMNGKEPSDSLANEQSDPLANEPSELRPEHICNKVIQEIDRFADGAEQSDDITMLCIRYNG